MHAGCCASAEQPCFMNEGSTQTCCRSSGGRVVPEGAAMQGARRQVRVGADKAGGVGRRLTECQQPCLHRLPSRPACRSAAVGFLPSALQASSTPWHATVHPGVQNPHWLAWAAAKASCTPPAGWTRSVSPADLMAACRCMCHTGRTAQLQAAGRGTVPACTWLKPVAELPSPSAVVTAHPSMEATGVRHALMVQDTTFPAWTAGLCPRSWDPQRGGGLLQAACCW
jgi:hypothetical protein